jgi:hypothetical protein
VLINNQSDVMKEHLLGIGTIFTSMLAKKITFSYLNPQNDNRRLSTAESSGDVRQVERIASHTSRLTRGIA